MWWSHLALLGPVRMRCSELRWFQKKVAVVVWELPPLLLHMVAEQSCLGVIMMVLHDGCLQGNYCRALSKLIVGFEDMCLLLVRDTENFLAGHMNVSARKGVFQLVVPWLAVASASWPPRWDSEKGPCCRKVDVAWPCVQCCLGHLASPLLSWLLKCLPGERATGRGEFNCILGSCCVEESVCTGYDSRLALPQVLLGCQPALLPSWSCGVLSGTWRRWNEGTEIISGVTRCQWRITGREQEPEGTPMILGMSPRPQGE